jgi:hypothetical protein
MEAGEPVNPWQSSTPVVRPDASGVPALENGPACGRSDNGASGGDVSGAVVNDATVNG